jgi:PAS domain S-box-containing protein
MQNHAPLSNQDRDDLILGAPLLIWRCNAEGSCDFFNEGWLQFTGRSFDDHAGDGWVESLHPDDREPILERFRKSLRQQAPFEAAYRLRHHSGGYRLVVDRATPRHDGFGEFHGFVGSCVDVTDRLEDLARLVRERARGNRRATLCTGCRKVEDDHGWQPITHWIAERFDAELVEGLCDSCEVRWERGA